jgi:cytosine/adenosine deaminase-related metal-dependent hydrolase
MRGIPASWVLIGDGETPPLRDGAVVVDARGVVFGVGLASELRAEFPGARWDAPRSAVLMPGLVNAHTHLELSALRGDVPGGDGFVPWVRQMVSLRAERGADGDEESIGEAVAELVRAGTAAVGEVSNSLASVSSLAQAPLVARVFAEVFGLTRLAADVMLGMARERIAELGALPVNVSVTLAPHTPFSLHPAVFEAICVEARAAGARTSVHLAEHDAERAFLRDGTGPFLEFLSARTAHPADWAPPGLDPVRYARSRGALGPHALAVHLTDARPDELALLVETNTPVVLCPRSNWHIERRVPPLEGMLAAGLRPGLGTDSLASSPSLDVLAEARALRARFPAVPARALVAMATSWGARALGVEALVGRLATGLAPGVLALAHASGAAPDDPEEYVLLERADAREVLVAPGRTLAARGASQ